MDEQTKDSSERAYEEFEKFRRTINNNWNRDITILKSCGEGSPVERESETGKPSTDEAVRGGDNIDRETK
ncbi:hypothetical protein PRIPAC_97164 [Pristionchus pacificus]|uniref:Uncharacterized protein n=1 Tax=Pristionchus pacificus TaxID=54126 RepID=A0A454XMT9_PRIPA|nr:hypothetical protein PRIPAC_97164 [Pristionchus pacificus]|eukprot:PDM60360.1 hypothetical protein PRIPAC_54185 [Pristionchus pacificus]